MNHTAEKFLGMDPTQNWTETMESKEKNLDAPCEEIELNTRKQATKGLTLPKHNRRGALQSEESYLD